MMEKHINKILAILILTISSCSSSRIYEMRGVDAISVIRLCENKRFSLYEYHTMVDIKDLLKGSWTKQKDTIYLTYDDQTYIQFDTLSTIKQERIDVLDSIKININTPKDSLQYFEVQINNKNWYETDLSGNLTIEKQNINSILVIHFEKRYYAMHNDIKKNKNIFHIILHKSFPDNVRLAYLNPTYKFYLKGSKLFPIDDKKIRKNYYFRKSKKTTRLVAKLSCENNEK